jgi:hypothetical protein
MGRKKQLKEMEFKTTSEEACKWLISILQEHAPEYFVVAPRIGFRDKDNQQVEWTINLQKWPKLKT